MRFIDKPEVALQTVNDRGVGAEERALTAEHHLEGRLPPDKLEFCGHPVFGNVPDRKLGQQRVEPDRGQLGSQGDPLL